VPLTPPAGYVLGKNCNDLKDPLGEGADILTILAPPEGVEAIALFNTVKDARQWAKQNASEYYPIEADAEELRHLLGWFVDQGGEQVAIFREGDDEVRFFVADAVRRHLGDSNMS
jgi:hypothetical protein